MTSRPSIAANIANANRQGKRNGTTSALVPSNGGVIDNGHRYFRVPPSDRLRRLVVALTPRPPV
jgi:hypothetical protein